MKRVKINEITVSDEMYTRVERIVETYNKTHTDLPTTVEKMMWFIVNAGLDHNNTVKFNIQQFELELGLRNEIETDSEFNYL